MPKFRDNQDREWNVHIDGRSIQEIRDDCDPLFLLNDGADQNTYTRLNNDSVLLCRVMVILCSGQMQAREVSEQDFYMQIIGDAIDRALEAVLQACINFSPKRQREILQAASELVKAETKMVQQAVAMALDRLRAPEFESAMQQEINTLVQNIPLASTR